MILKKNQGQLLFIVKSICSAKTKPVSSEIENHLCWTIYISCLNFTTPGSPTLWERSQPRVHAVNWLLRNSKANDLSIHLHQPTFFFLENSQPLIHGIVWQSPGALCNSMQNDLLISRRWHACIYLTENYDGMIEWRTSEWRSSTFYSFMNKYRLQALRQRRGLFWGAARFSRRRFSEPPSEGVRTGFRWLCVLFFALFFGSAVSIASAVIFDCPGGFCRELSWVLVWLSTNLECSGR